MHTYQLHPAVRCDTAEPCQQQVKQQVKHVSKVKQQVKHVSSK
jgi:hypothetical protein